LDSASRTASSPATRAHPAIILHLSEAPDIPTTDDALCRYESIGKLAVRSLASQEVGEQDGGMGSVGHAAREDNASRIEKIHRQIQS